jgi:hypothetical protein
VTALQAAIHARLAADTAFASQLATIASVPAIATERPVPPDMPLPYAVVNEPASNTPFDTKTTRGREVLLDVGIFVSRESGAALCEDLAELARDAIHREPLAVAGYGNLVASVTGPVGAPADNLHGRIITVRTVLMRK